LRGGGLAPAAGALHSAVRIDSDLATRLFGTPHQALIVSRARSDAALDVTDLIRHRTASLFGTEHLAGSIRCALALSAHNISILVLEAILGIDLGGGSAQGQQAANEESMFHGGLLRFAKGTCRLRATPN
jgi:hypothetical protein